MLTTEEPTAAVLVSRALVATSAIDAAYFVTRTVQCPVAALLDEARGRDEASEDSADTTDDMAERGQASTPRPRTSQVAPGDGYSPRPASQSRALESLALALLVDNERGVTGLRVEHGFACWIGTEHGALLFDTGAGGVLVDNARHLGVDLASVSVLVLSHGHYDHTGGVAALVERAGSVRVVAHPAFDGPHRSRSTGTDRDIGLPASARSALDRVAVERRREPLEVLPGVWTTGEIRRVTGEDAGSRLFADPEGLEPDPVPDDQALVLRHRTGLVVVFGCAHAGVQNTLLHVRGMFPGVPVRGVVGGMHLEHAPAGRVEATLAALDELGDALVAPAHCTGVAARRRIQAGLGDRFREVVVGSRLELCPDGAWGQG